MQKSILLFIGLVTIASLTLYNIQPDAQISNMNLFEIWKAKMGKHYDTSQNSFRFKIWFKSYQFVSEHNKRFQQGLEPYNVQINHFADLTDQQFAAKYMGLSQQIGNTTKCTGSQVPIKDLPESVDWTDKGAVTPVKDQGECGSCWAFSATGSLQGVHFLTKNKLLSFSEQQLVDCSRYVNNGCHGGIMDGAFYYVKDHGITVQSQYPYKGVDSECVYNPDAQKVWQISDCTDVTPFNQKALMAAIAKHPVSVPVDAAHLPFRLYKSGVFDGYCGHTLGHGILAVGYGHQDRKQYYHVKNSWGTSWGNKGFMFIKRGGDGKGHCGIQIAPKFPIA